MYILGMKKPTVNIDTSFPEILYGKPPALRWYYTKLLSLFLQPNRDYQRTLI